MGYGFYANTAMFDTVEEYAGYDRFEKILHSASYRQPSGNEYLPVARPTSQGLEPLSTSVFYGPVTCKSKYGWDDRGVKVRHLQVQTLLVNREGDTRSAVRALLFGASFPFPTSQRYFSDGFLLGVLFVLLIIRGIQPDGTVCFLFRCANSMLYQVCFTVRS